MKKCVKCGQKLSNDALFCHLCGERQIQKNKDFLILVKKIKAQTGLISKKIKTKHIVTALISTLIVFTLAIWKTSRLEWSNRSPIPMDWEAALLYCQELREKGHNDWRMPNIDELRSIIKNCSETNSGGKCKVSEKNDCLTDNCWNSCYCDDKENNNGYYSKLGDDDRIALWSSSTLPRTDNNIVGVELSYDEIQKEPSRNKANYPAGFEPCEESEEYSKYTTHFWHIKLKNGGVNYSGNTVYCTDPESEFHSINYIHYVRCVR